MVKITDYKLRESHEGKPFFALTLQGGVEIVKSVEGKMYATIRKASIPTTFDEITCQSLLGSELPGSITKVECEPYNYTVPNTGEIIMLTYRFEYSDIEQPVKKDFIHVYRPSNNGVKERF
jgi:hypothetical protein